MFKDLGLRSVVGIEAVVDCIGADETFAQGGEVVPGRCCQAEEGNFVNLGDRLGLRR